MRGSWSREPSAMSSEEHWMRRAIELARRSIADGGGPFGAVVVRAGEIVGSGNNRVTLDVDPTAHAEIVAIRDACRRLCTFDLRGCAVFASCEPCPMCLGALHWARVERVWFGASCGEAARAGFDDARIYRELAKPIEARELAMRPLLCDEASAVLREWLAAPNRREY
jgi:tRNA(Arg) A34 adenosine deaminase TadA